jgi:hypothetical protein
MKKKNRQVRKTSLKPKSATRLVVLSSALLIFSFVSVFIYSNLGSSKKSLAALGMHGSKTVTTTNVILNEFTTLTSNASSGTTSITVASSSLNANSRFAGNLSTGELVMIIQMQGATMNTSSSTSSVWGTITAYNNAGKCEFNEVSGVPNSTTIDLVYPLLNSYTSSGKVQVIRVPRYSSLTVNSGASVTTQAWNGSTGGVLAVEVNGNTVMNGTMDVSGLGFRGGAVDNGSAASGTLVTLYASTDSLQGGEKGEGIAGSQTTYDGLGGRYGRGAAGNGGGGGNSHNSGGGGGANSGSVAAWNGFGNPDTSTVSSWKSAWDLETANFHANISEGGGRGGYSWSKLAKNPLTTAPGNSLWQGNDRANVGGNGGRPADNSGNRIFMGGGGGAGDANNSVGTAGANGGGIIYLLGGGTVSGTGILNSNGSDAANVGSSGNSDAAGAGGAGGSVIIYTSGASISNLTINAKGGKGGNQNDPSTEAEGPGGGGSGGYISTTNSNSLTRNATGGKNGTTSSSAMTTFLPNGATSGWPGVITLSPPNLYSGTVSLPVELKSFSGEVKNKTIELTWITASEINNDYFTIEKSADGKEFSLIAKINGAGNSTVENNYALIDDAPLNGINYYRIVQTDYDGSVRKYNTIRVNYKDKQNRLQICGQGPNPFNDLLHVDYNAEESGMMEIRILNSNAQLIRSEQLIAGSGINSFFFSDVSDLKNGIYFLQLLQGNNKSEAVRIIKN